MACVHWHLSDTCISYLYNLMTDFLANVIQLYYFHANLKPESY